MKIEPKQWGFYLANVPFWDQSSLSYKHKTRPVMIYNFSGGDFIALPITSNEDKNGKNIKNDKPWLVSVKLQKHSLIKVNKPITLSKDSLFRYFGIVANTKVRRQVKESWGQWTTLREIKR